MMLLEALAAGTPAVVSDIPENLDVLPDGVATFKAGDAADLARALREALAVDPAEARARAAEAARVVRAEHDWDRIAEQYMAVYESVVRGASSRSCFVQRGFPEQARQPRILPR